MLYTVDSNADEPIMLLNAPIGVTDDQPDGISGARFAAELMALDALGKKCIKVWINSPGGVVLDGYDIYTAILRSKTPVDTYCVGMAASIAAVIFQAGRKRVIMDYGVLMFHNPKGSDDDSAISAVRESLINMISGRSGKDAPFISEMMDRTTFLSASEALETGMADSMEVSVDFNRKRLRAAPTSMEGVQNMWREANKVINSYLNKPNMNLRRITDRLQLVPEANEDAILQAIAGIENRNRDLSVELTNAQNSATALQTQLTDLQAIHNTLQSEHSAMQSAAAKVSAEAMVDKYLARINNDAAGTVRAMWVERAVSDLAGTETLLNSLPINKAAAQLDDPNKPDNSATVDMFTAGGAMHAIRNRMGLNK